MKNIANLCYGLLLLTLVMFSSCTGVPNDKDVESFVDNNDLELVHNYDANGKIISNSYVPVEKVVLKPSFSQTIEYSFKSGYGVKLFVGVLFLAGCGVWIYYMSKDQLPTFFKNSHQSETLFNQIVAGILLLLALVFILNQPINVGLNRKFVRKFHFDEVVKSYGSSQPIWDSLYSRNLILGAAKK